MIKYILFFFVAFSVTLTAQSHDSDPLEEPDMTESMDEALDELSKLLEGNSLDSMMMKAFDGINMQDLNGTLDSLGISEMFGGEQLSEMFQDMDMSQLNEMMEQSMKMLEGMDLEKMMENIDLSEMMKMFEGMDIQGMEEMIPTPEKREKPSEKEKKKLKKI